MEVATRRRSIGGIFRGLARHPKTVAFATLSLIVVGLGVCWAGQLWGLPDVGDPFDVAAFEAERIPDDRNAYYLYRDAASMSSATMQRFRASKMAPDLSHFPSNWAGASPPWRDLLTQSSEALALWRRGSEKTDARYDHPEGISIRTLLPITQELAMLGTLAVLEGSRLASEGDMAGAWSWYRSALRASRHNGKHGFPVERMIGAAKHNEASKALTGWAADPRVDAPLLRRALDEVIAIDAMTVSHSETLKVEYLLLVHELANPNLINDLLVSKDMGAPVGWCNDLPISDAGKVTIQAARVLVANDRERCRRIVRLMTANWLAQLEKPTARRSKLAHDAPPIYEADPSDPPASRALAPERLAGWIDSSLLASRIYSFLPQFILEVDRERVRQARLVVHLASELHRREHGGTAPTSPQALVGPYLKSLPEGFDATVEPEAKP